MKRLDNGKVSLVEFLRSIKPNRNRSTGHGSCTTHFAGFNPQARNSNQEANPEDLTLVRSYN